MEFNAIYEIDNMSGPALQYYVKGHVDIEEFCKEFYQEYQDIADKEFVHHEYWRWVPMKDPDYNSWNRMQFNSKPGRGAFKVTTFDVEEMNLAKVKIGRSS